MSDKKDMTLGEAIDIYTQFYIAVVTKDEEMKKDCKERMQKEGAEE